MKLAVDIRTILHSRAREFVLDVRFQCNGERVVVFGPSGSGKTVTMQAIAGLLRPDAGSIVLNDVTLFDAGTRLHVPARQRRVGYVFQDYALFPHLSVADNVAFGLRGADIRSGLSLAELLETFALTELADSFPGQISGGQRQRVALARALAPQPAMLLLDEPFAALDPQLRTRMRHELLRILERFEVPMVLISHDPEDVAVFAEQVLMFNDGRVEGDHDVRTQEDRQQVFHGLHGE